jgi:pre-mRNA-splicing factor CDC5/CEF1
LALVRIMPTQFRSISSIVGRSTNDCIIRYQQLLDDQEKREAGDLGLTGPAGGETAAPTAEDVRRLRPGEVDAYPESRPARPDAVGMNRRAPSYPH